MTDLDRRGSGSFANVGGASGSSPYQDFRLPNYSLLKASAAPTPVPMDYSQRISPRA